MQFTYIKQDGDNEEIETDRGVHGKVLRLKWHYSSASKCFPATS